MTWAHPELTFSINIADLAVGFLKKRNQRGKNETKKKYIYIKKRELRERTDRQGKIHKNSVLIYC